MSATSCQVGAVSEKLPFRTNGQTNERMNGGDSIGPFGFQPGTNKDAAVGIIREKGGNSLKEKALNTVVVTIGL